MDPQKPTHLAAAAFILSPFSFIASICFVALLYSKLGTQQLGDSLPLTSLGFIISFWFPLVS